MATRVAGIDCGTNAVRLLIADLPDLPDPLQPADSGTGTGTGTGTGNGLATEAGSPAGSAAAPLTDVVRRMEIVRLGEGVDRTRRLAPAAIERTRQALTGYAAELAAHGVERVRMCATSASRDADNADEFVAMVQATLGVTPEVVTGDEEARLTFAGAVGGLAATASAPYLVVDIGGGSSEFVVGADTVHRAVSVDVGCVRMTERHLRADPPTPAQIAAAERDIAAAVDRALSVVTGPDRSGPPPTLVGLAGSVTTVAGIALRLDSYRADRLHHARISYDQVAEVTADLLAMPVGQRLRIPVMHPGRADVIAAGALVLRIVMERADVSSVVASEHDILDGICLSLTGSA